MAVIFGTAALAVLIVVAFQPAGDEFAASQTQRRDDTLVAGGEAMLERYAAKLTIDPLYYLNRVDEAEMPRRCADTGSSNYGLRSEPGTAWFANCTSWDYEAASEYFHHPLLDGDPDVEADDMVALLTVSPPTVAEPLEVTVVTRHLEFGQARSITAEIAPESIAEFVFLVDQSLRFGSGAVIDGKIYVGQNLDFARAPVRGTVSRDIFAENAIGHYSGLYGPPIFLDGAEAWDGIGEFNDIRDAYPEPLDFANFWDDLELIRTVACNGSGLCLDRDQNPGLGLSSDPTAWLVEPIVDGGIGRLRVSATYSSSSSGCVSSEEWWWLNSQSASWSTVGTFDIPPSGAVWADSHVILGRGTAGTVKGAVTIAAGSAGAPKNIVIGADLLYADGLAGTDVLGLAATDEVWVNPNSVGADGVLNINAALLAQGGAFQVARTCGDSGDVLLPWSGGQPTSTLNTNGAMAIRHTGDVAAHFSPRNYGFDSRLERLRPPLFPLLGDGWQYQSWRETDLPCWARASGGC